MEVDVVEDLGADSYLYGRTCLPGNMTEQAVIVRSDGRNSPQRGIRVRPHPRTDHLRYVGTEGRPIP